MEFYIIDLDYINFELLSLWQDLSHDTISFDLKVWPTFEKLYPRPFYQKRCGVRIDTKKSLYGTTLFYLWQWHLEKKHFVITFKPNEKGHLYFKFYIPSCKTFQLLTFFELMTLTIILISAVWCVTGTMVVWMVISRRALLPSDNCKRVVRVSMVYTTCLSKSKHGFKNNFLGFFCIFFITIQILNHIGTCITLLRLWKNM